MRTIHFIACLLLGLLLFPAWSLASEEPIAVIVSPDKARLINRDELTLIFKRKKLFWNDGSKIRPVNLPVSNPVRRVFSQMVLGASPEDLEKYWNDLYFHGVSPPFVLSSAQAVMRFIINTPDSIGYVPYCSVDTHVEIVLVIYAGHISDSTPSYTCPK